MARRQGGEVIALEAVREQAASSVLPVQGLADPPTIREYLDIIIKRIWAVAIFFVIVVAFTGVWVFREPRVYHTSALVELNPVPPTILATNAPNPTDSPMGTWQSKEFFETQAQIIQTRTVCDRVVKKLGLDHDASFLGLDSIKDRAKREQLMRGADAVATLQGHLRVDPVRESRIAKITVEDTSPERAMRIVNTLAQEYTDYNLERRYDATKNAQDWLGDRQTEIKTSLGMSEDQLRQFEQQHNLHTASLEDREKIASTRLLELNDALTKVTLERNELSARLHTFADAEKKLASGDDLALESVPSIAQDATISSLQMQRLSVLEERATLAAKYTPEHPKRIEVERRLDEINSELSHRIKAKTAEATAAAKEVIDQEKQIRANITEAEHDLAEVNKLKFDYTKLKREVEENLNRYQTVNELKKDFQIAGQSRLNNVQPVEWAITPHTPFKPNRKLIMTLAIILGLLGGIGMALLFEYLDNTMKTHDDVEKFLNAAFLGIVPSIRENNNEPMTALERGRYRDLYSHRRPKSSVAECVRSVRTNLLFMTPEKQLKRLLVTSSGPQEGKTTFVTNVAITMAQSGSKTLIIDTDMRRPRIHRAFGLPNDIGMSSLILQAARLDEAVKETLVPNLYILPCGPIPPNPSELLHTARFKQILAEAEGKFDRVILDSPPIAAVTDALILAGEVDGVVMVVKAGRTIREVALRTKQALDDVNARLFGVVLNDLDLERRGYGYYYYYQRYGYYYGEKPTEA